MRIITTQTFQLANLPHGNIYGFDTNVLGGRLVLQDGLLGKRSRQHRKCLYTSLTKKSQIVTRKDMDAQKKRYEPIESLGIPHFWL